MQNGVYEVMGASKLPLLQCITKIQTIMASYRELRSLQPDGSKIFFAFSQKQFEEGLRSIGATKDEVVSGLGGVIGRKEDVLAFIKFYDDIDKRVAKECTPQEVYEDEFWNHESAYTWNDSTAYKIAVAIFGKERCEKEITSLLSYHKKYLFFNKRTNQWQHYDYGDWGVALCTAIYDEHEDIAKKLGLDRRNDIGKVIPLD